LRRLNKEVLFFDLDGTLLNTLEGITNSFNYALDKAGRELIGSVKNYIGPPLAHTLERLIDDPDDIIKIIADYRKYYIEKGVYECAPYEGIAGTLKELKTRGYRLYVATSKPTQIAISLLKRFNLADYFIEIYGADDDSKSGSKDKILNKALKSSGERADNSIMIGDTVWDLEGAALNGVAFGAVTYGFGDGDTIIKPDNIFTAESPVGILKFL
jgi:phosphoglycolate phosphatase